MRRSIQEIGMGTVLFASMGVSVSTGSDWFDDDIELVNDLDAGTLVEDANGYTQWQGDVASLLLLIIFFMGMAAGLIGASIMWRRIR